MTLREQWNKFWAPAPWEAEFHALEAMGPENEGKDYTKITDKIVELGLRGLNKELPYKDRINANRMYRFMTNRWSLILCQLSQYRRKEIEELRQASVPKDPS